MLNWTSPLTSLSTPKEQERPTWTATSVVQPKLKLSKTLKSSTTTTIRTQSNTHLCSRWDGTLWYACLLELNHLHQNFIWEILRFNFIHSNETHGLHRIKINCTRTISSSSTKPGPVPCLQGPLGLAVTYGGDHIPKSPFNVAVAPTVDLSKISVTGLGDSTHLYCCI